MKKIKLTQCRKYKTVDSLQSDVIGGIRLYIAHTLEGTQSAHMYRCPVVIISWTKKHNNYAYVLTRFNGLQPKSYCNKTSIQRTRNE